jgi:hypothetical protein
VGDGGGGLGAGGAELGEGVAQRLGADALGARQGGHAADLRDERADVTHLYVDDTVLSGSIRSRYGDSSHSVPPVGRRLR